MTTLIDQQARNDATAPDHSVLVRAPAGSGKTGVLLLRLLNCLCRVDEPEFVSAVTFTKKAAAEIRERVIEALLNASDTTYNPSNAHESNIHQSALAVLRHAAKRNWGLLENPQRLRVDTFDSLCAAIVRRLPIESGMASIRIADDPKAIYRDAIIGLFADIESNTIDTELQGSLSNVLSYAQNRIEQLVPLLSSLIEKRDQWDESTQTLDLDAMSAAFASHLSEVHASLIQTLKAHRFDDAIRITETMSGESEELAWAAGLSLLTGADAVAGHARLASLLTTEGASPALRKSGGITKKIGFPPKHPCTEELKALLQAWQDSHDLGRITDALLALRSLPAPEVPTQSRALINDLMRVLQALLGRIERQFSAAGEVDFSQVAARAINAITPPAGATSQFVDDLLQEERIEHILVDEMQDTSVNQIRLLSNLTHGWTPGNGRSLFLCGDIQQSIYAFRGTVVSEFDQLVQSQSFGALPLTLLQLQANFRSEPEPVGWVNSVFQNTFRDCYAPAVAQKGGSGKITVHPFAASNATSTASQEAERVADIIEETQAGNANGSIAVLGRTKAGFRALIPVLKQRGIAYAGQDIDLLAQSPAVSDFWALLRAWWHDHDHSCWMSVLRAPFVGLTWDDCLVLSQAEGSLRTVLLSGSADRKLSEDGKWRAAHLRETWELVESSPRSVDIRWAVPALWHSLGGAACVTETEKADILRATDLLHQHAPGGILRDISALESSAARLFASSATAPVELMTIHKSKGLEFDTVIMSGLGEKDTGGDSELFHWERLNGELVIAPKPMKGGAGEDTEAVEAFFKYIGAMKAAQQSAEVNRLLYVAFTRAKQDLHLVGRANYKDGAILPPRRDSLLYRIWDHVSPEFDSATIVEGDNALDSSCVAVPTRARVLHIPELQLGGVAVECSMEDGEAAAEITEELSDSNIKDRAVGLAYHEVLQFAATRGTDVLTAPEKLLPRLRATLLRHNHPLTELDESLSRLIGLLTKTGECKTAQWILERREVEGTEQAIWLTTQGRQQKLIVDRYFVEGDTCWIIDYKTAAGSGESFLAEQTELYRPKMQLYQSALTATGVATCVKAALYMADTGSLIEIT